VAAAPAPAAQAPVAAPAAAAVAAAAVAAPEQPAPAPAPTAAAASAPAAAAVPELEAAPAAAHSVRIEDVVGIGHADAEKLGAIGIATSGDLLAAGAKPHDREKLAQTTGISGSQIRDWVDKVDLMRVPGVGPQYSELLEAAGVDSPAELAQRNPANLAITVQEVVAARPGIVHRIPNEAEVASWVEAAAALDKVVEH
jgi:predicted flap endonuclease-1-like 5' DNA nuclease